MLQSQSSSLLLSACSLFQKSLARHVIACGLAAVQAEQSNYPAAAGRALQQQRFKHEVRVVLLKDHKKLGKAGDLIDVKAGHARYTLFPHGVADYAVPSVIRDLRARGFLTPQAISRLQPGAEQQAEVTAAHDPGRLPLEQQLPQILHQLSEKGVVISRRFNFRLPEEPMIGEITAPHLVHAVAQQLKIHIPNELVMMRRGEPIKQFGSFRVPLNLQNDDGTQAELAVTVAQTRRSNRVRQLEQKYLFAMKSMQAQQQRQQSQQTDEQQKQQTA